MRTIWNGSVNFGLVNIPIGLAVAQQRKDVAFRTLHRECGTPIKQKRWCPTHDREVESDEIVAAARRNGVPVEYLLFPDEGHGFVKKENEVRGYSAVVAFLDRYLKPGATSAAVP